MIKILVVEDEPGIAFGIENDLLAEGYDVTVACDGNEAVRRARAETFDLILLDVMLPHKDGLEVCRELRNGGLTTPIVMLTAKTGEFDKVMGLDLGADDYVTKPFSVRELRARIRTALRHQPSGASMSPDLQWQLSVASDVQRRLFPQLRPPMSTLDYAGFCQPALAMSGDYYDFLDLSPGKLGLLLVDVSGKGIPAALLMASVHGAMRTHAPRFGNLCGELLVQLNTLLYESTDAAMYATMFYAVYDEVSRVLTYSNAGHEPPVLLRTRADASVEFLRLDARTIPVGLLPKLPVLQTTIQLVPGDRLVIFTDGVTEARNEQEEEFGAARLMAVVGGSFARNAQEMSDAIVTQLTSYSRRVPQADDITLITARVQ
jgi:sigma-B regulation protein RsbU (phosphoserine phosphatase)